MTRKQKRGTLHLGEKHCDEMEFDKETQGELIQHNDQLQLVLSEDSLPLWMINSFSIFDKDAEESGCCNLAEFSDLFRRRTMTSMRQLSGD